MIKELNNLFKRDLEETRATPDDYEVLFSSDIGQRVLIDLMKRYHVGKPSFSFDKQGRVNLEASARSDAAKVIISDIVSRGKLRDSYAEKSKSKKDEGAKLSHAATNI